MFSCYRTGDLPVSEGAASRSRYDVKAAEEDENRRESRSGSLSVRVHEQSGIWEQAPSYGTTHGGLEQSLGRQAFLPKGNRVQNTSMVIFYSSKNGISGQILLGPT